MGKPIYKYVGPGYLDKVFEAPKQVTLKCSYPKDFNDPYELFLTIDFKELPGVLAFYADVIGKLPQLPTTCFSRSPIVIPMWAHYAQNSQGFVIEFDEEKLAKSFPKSGFGDVDYEDSADEDLAEVLHRAFEIGKPRYLYMLHKGVFSAAYYTKATCWSYELERRMIVRPSETRADTGLVLMDVPQDCVTALISGPMAPLETAQTVHAKADELGCKYYDLKVGKTSPVPFLVDLDGTAFTFNGARIKKSSRQCASCKEPLDGKSKRCSWCRIEEAHERDAAERNTFRVLANTGLLEKYIEDMDNITHGARKRDA